MYKHLFFTLNTLIVLIKNAIIYITKIQADSNRSLTDLYLTEKSAN